MLLRSVIIEEKSVEVGAFVAANRSALERALVARFGMADGLEAAAHAVEYSIAQWDRISGMNNPVGYLFRVGNTYGLRAARNGRRVSELVTDPSTNDERADIDLQRALVRLSWEQRVAIVLVHAHGHAYAQGSWTYR